MDKLPIFSLRHIINQNATLQKPSEVLLSSILNKAAFLEAKAEIHEWPDYKPTPLVSLAGLADMLGIDCLFYKDESKRFSLKSFKALGGAYAVLRVVARELNLQGIKVEGLTDLLAGTYLARIKAITVCCATDGNHGRAVAWAAQMIGCRSLIYLHEGVSPLRAREIEAYGADICRVSGSYDDSVRQAAKDADINGWFVVSDTSWDNYEEIPTWVMQGYMVMAEEADIQWPVSGPITHIVVQGGVGGLAAAVSGYFWRVLGDKRPRMILVEPDRADCITRSIIAGTPVTVGGNISTFMACLAAAEMSPVAWKILKHTIDDAIVIPDNAAKKTMHLLANGIANDPCLVSGESGCASTAALIAACRKGEVFKSLGLDRNARVLVIGSEGATDPEIYQKIVGMTAEEVIDRKP